MRKLVRQSRRSDTVRLESTVRPSIPVGRIKTAIALCNQHIEYGDNKAATAKHERADAADFYRRAAMLAISELNNLINKKEN